MERRQNGFTLLELLVVIAILGLLAGIVGPQMIGRLGSAKADTAKLQVADLGQSLDLFLLENGRYPTSAEGLQALVVNPGDLPSWNGPYLRKGTVPLDPWGQPYQYRAPGEHGVFDIMSLGADQKPGGSGDARDILSWE